MFDLSSAIFKIDAPASAPGCGTVLVSNPFVSDSDFRHSVVSVIDYYRDEGATGVVMNAPAGYDLDEVLDGVPSGSHIPVYCGGPLGRDRLYFLHTLGPDIIGGARAFAPGLFVGGDFEAVLGYLDAGYEVSGNLRFFVGYGSWGPGQLEDEISHGDWASLRAVCAEDLFRGRGDAYWHRTVRGLGDAFRPWDLVPRFPQCN